MPFAPAILGTHDGATFPLHEVKVWDGAAWVTRDVELFIRAGSLLIESGFSLLAESGNTLVLEG